MLIFIALSVNPVASAAPRTAQVSKPAFLASLRQGAFQGCEGKVRDLVMSVKQQIEPWLVEEFIATQNSQSEFNCLLYLNCIAPNQYNGLIAAKVKTIAADDPVRRTRLLASLTESGGKEIPENLLSLTETDDIALLGQVARLCMKRNHSDCKQKLKTRLSHLEKDSTISGNNMYKMLRKHGIE